MRRIVIGAVVLVCAALLFSGVQAQFSMESGGDKKIRGNVEVVAGRFGCDTFGGAQITFEGTSDFANNRFEFRRSVANTSADCPILANALALRAQQLSCVTGAITPFGVLDFMCHGERNTVVGTAGALASEFLTFPLSP